jgi:uncharacterized protein (TIGR02301 family)
MRALILALLISGAAWAQESTPSLQPGGGQSYQSRLLRLSEILGALHFVRAQCEPAEDVRWRDRMQELIRLERPSTEQRNAMVVKFNDGYGDAKSRFSVCTDAARVYAANIAGEGETISRTLAQSVDQAGGQ